MSKARLLLTIHSKSIRLVGPAADFSPGSNYRAFSHTALFRCAPHIAALYPHIHTLLLFALNQSVDRSPAASKLHQVGREIVRCKIMFACPVNGTLNELKWSKSDWWGATLGSINQIDGFGPRRYGVYTGFLSCGLWWMGSAIFALDICFQMRFAWINTCCVD